MKRKLNYTTSRRRRFPGLCILVSLAATMAIVWLCWDKFAVYAEVLRAISHKRVDEFVYVDCGQNPTLSLCFADNWNELMRRLGHTNSSTEAGVYVACVRRHGHTYALQVSVRGRREREISIQRTGQNGLEEVRRCGIQLEGVTVDVANKSLVRRRYTVVFSDVNADSSSLRIHSGKQDHDDSSKFSIPLEMDGRKVLLDGGLGPSSEILITVSDQANGVNIVP